MIENQHDYHLKKNDKINNKDNFMKINACPSYQIIKYSILFVPWSRGYAYTDEHICRWKMHHALFVPNSTRGRGDASVVLLMNPSSGETVLRILKLKCFVPLSRVDLN